MKKLLAVGGMMAAPFILQAMGQLPNVILVLAFLGSGGGSFANNVIVGLAALLGGAFAGGNLLLGALAAL